MQINVVRACKVIIQSKIQKCCELIVCTYIYNIYFINNNVAVSNRSRLRVCKPNQHFNQQNYRIKKEEKNVSFRRIAFSINRDFFSCVYGYVYVCMCVFSRLAQAICDACSLVVAFYRSVPSRVYHTQIPLIFVIRFVREFRVERFA